MPHESYNRGHIAPISTRNQVFHIGGLGTGGEDEKPIWAGNKPQSLPSYIAKIAISLFIGTIAAQPLFKLLKFAEPKLNSLHLSVEKENLKKPKIGDRPQNQTLNTSSLKSLPSVRDTAQAMKEYWQVVESIRSEGTLSKEEIKAQGFDIQPKTPFKIRRALVKDKGAEINNNPTYTSQIAELNTQNNNEVTYLKHPYKKGIFVKGQPKRYPHNKIEKFYFVMDMTSKEHLLRTASSLSEETTLTQTKRLLGTPSKDTFITDTSQPGEIQRALVYSIQQFKPGVSTPDKDEHLVITFDELNMVKEVYTSHSKNGNNQKTKDLANRS